MNGRGLLLSPGVGTFYGQPESAAGGVASEFPALASWKLLQSKAGRRRGLFLVEGYASVTGIPVPREHTWCATAGGQVVDPGWNGDGDHYFGVAVAEEFAARYYPERFNSLLLPESPLLKEPMALWRPPGGYLAILPRSA